MMTHRTDESVSGQAKIYINNSTVINRIKKGIRQRMTATSRMCQHYDVLRADPMVVPSKSFVIDDEQIRRPKLLSLKRLDCTCVPVHVND